MRRLLAALGTLVVGWLAAVQAPMAYGAPHAEVPVHIYDAHHPVASPVQSASERGPPASADSMTVQHVIDRWSRGTSARLESVATGAKAPYTTHTTPIGIGNATTATGSPRLMRGTVLTGLDDRHLRAARALAISMPVSANGNHVTYADGHTTLFIRDYQQYRQAMESRRVDILNTVNKEPPIPLSRRGRPWLEEWLANHLEP